MRALPDDFDAGDLTDALRRGWGVDIEDTDYAPVGGGSYHWLVRDAAGRRGFATVDDLTRKPWLGTSADTVHDGLRSAYDTAMALRDEGLAFVVAPGATRAGTSLHRAGSRYAVALFPFLDGPSGDFERYDPDERASVETMLAGLHSVPEPPAAMRRLELDLPGRRELEDALGDLDARWTAGPLAERARELLRGRADDLAELLALFERLAAAVAGHGWVVTHGEPHAGNVVRTAEGYHLVDWDTVALGPPERDLWWLLREEGHDTPVYTARTGRRPDAAAVSYFRLRWDLADAAAFTGVLRAPHSENADTAKALHGLATCTAIREQWRAELG